ncbi:MAG: hypothetical protein EA379_01890 [Phycisphaerales bacterium]|nr:MAG: hypothetical protein EA379_01890 [Phycisphaerales bacterium]
MNARARTWLIVVIVTALVWLYAEAESLTRSEQEMRIAFASPTPDLVARVVGDEWRGSVRVRIEGSSAALGQAPRALRFELGEPGVSAAEGEHEIDLRSALRASREIQRAGINVLDVEPATVRLRVETVLALEGVEVRPELIGVELTGGLTIDPPRVAVRAPRAFVDALRASPTGAHVMARIPRAALTNIVEGQENRVRARLLFPEGLQDPSAEITPGEVELIFTVRSRTDSLSAPSAPVQVLLPPREAGRWRIDINPEDAFIRDVQVTGPGDVIERIRSRELRIIAVLWLSSDELERRLDAKRATFALVRDDQTTALPAGLVIDAPETLVRLSIEPAPEPVEP